ncbi:MAG: hypothetical protein ACK5YA_01020, partial [bacterium]
EEIDEFDPINYDENAFDKQDTEEKKNLYESSHNRNATNSLGDEEIDEEIVIDPDESYEKSLKKVSFKYID